MYYFLAKNQKARSYFSKKAVIIKKNKYILPTKSQKLAFCVYNLLNLRLKKK